MWGWHGCFAAVAASAMRALRLFAWWCVGVAIAWVWMIPYARAETIVVGPANWSCYVVDNQPDACAAHCGTLQGGQAYISQVDALTVQCLGPTGAIQYTGNKNSCPAGQFHNSNAPGMCQQNVPACVAPNVRLPDNSCGIPNPCPPAGQPHPQGAQGVTGTGSSSVPATVCRGGCQYETSGGMGFGDSNEWFARTGASTGQTCAPGAGEGDATDKRSECAAKGEGYGEVNGVGVCTGKPSTTKETKTTTTPTSTTTTTTTTTCTGGSCNTTTTNNYTSGGSGPNGTGPGSTTVPGTGPGTPGEGVGSGGEEQSQSSFCQENPTAAICRPASDECAENPNKVGCGEYGTLPDVQPSTQAVPFNITPAVVPMNASCPSSVALPYGAVFSWQPICDGLGWIRPVILALAGLGAALIVVGGFQRG